MAWTTTRATHMPPKQPAIERTTLATAESVARPAWPASINSAASRLNVENVVYPPQNPAISMARTSGVAAGMASRNRNRNPRSSDPLTLITSVPTGNVVPSRCCTAAPSKKRVTPPTALPSATSQTERDMTEKVITTEERVALGDVAFDLLRPENSDTLISEADYVMDERLPYWADLWPSSHVLAARVLEDTPARGRAMELGCGLGLVTIAALRAGYDVLATDYYAQALEFTQENVRRALARDVTTQLVDWTAPPPLDPFDLVLAADVLYEHRYGPVVADMLGHALGPAGRALVADPGRIGVADFFAALPDFGLRLASEEVRPFTDGKVHQRITLYTIRH